MPRRQNKGGSHQRGGTILLVWKLQLADSPPWPALGIRKASPVYPPIHIQLTPLLVRAAAVCGLGSGDGLW